MGRNNPGCFDEIGVMKGGGLEGGLGLGVGVASCGCMCIELENMAKATNNTPRYTWLFLIHSSHSLGNLP